MTVCAIFSHVKETVQRLMFTEKGNITYVTASAQLHATDVVVYTTLLATSVNTRSNGFRGTNHFYLL